MVLITKSEMEKLTEMGIKFGENGISHSSSGHNKYYLAETSKNMSLLNKIRKHD